MILRLLGLLLTSARVFHASPSGSDTNSVATASEPLQTLCACVSSLAHAGDECRLHAGNYTVGTESCNITGLKGTSTSPIVIASAGDGRVLIDGTVPIPGPWAKDPSSRLYSAAAPDPVFQLFIDGEMQVLARYPNAHWSNKTMFLANEYWMKSSKGGTHDVKTGKGVLLDTGACPDPADCCALCNSQDLAKSGINGTGALLIANLWRCDTGAQRVTKHIPGSATLEYTATWNGSCDSYQKGQGRYYLEGSPELLDADCEWAFDRGRSEVLRTSPPAAGAEVRGRVGGLALRIKDSVFVTVANMSFHAAAVSAGGLVSDIRFEGLDLDYAAYSRRSLGEASPPVASASIWSNDIDDVGTRYGGHVVDDVGVRYGDGPALLLQGNRSMVAQSSFEWNDYTTIGNAWATDAARGGTSADDAKTLRLRGAGLRLRRLSFANNGAAQATNAFGKSEATVVELCHFRSQLSIQDDGTFVEGGGEEATHMVRNWCRDTGKLALRWDQEYPKTGRRAGGQMVENVAWNTSAMVVKGDNHNVSFNTVFDGADIAEGLPAHDRPRYQDAGSALNNASVASIAVGKHNQPFNPDANAHTTFSHNILDNMTAEGKGCHHQPAPVADSDSSSPRSDSGSNKPKPNHCFIPGHLHDNLVFANDSSLDIRAQLRDPFHLDFRPCPGSAAAAADAGAYRAGDTAGDAYWVPGRQLYTAVGTPIPPDGAVAVKTDADLMFLPMRGGGAHRAYLGRSRSSMALVGMLEGDANVVHNTARLPSDTAHFWRVDAVDAEGRLVTGAVWTFRTGSKRSCEVAPTPPPSPAPPTPARPTPAPTPTPPPSPPSPPMPSTWRSYNHSVCYGAGEGMDQRYFLDDKSDLPSCQAKCLRLGCKCLDWTADKKGKGNECRLNNESTKVKARQGPDKVVWTAYVPSAAWHIGMPA